MTSWTEAHAQERASEAELMVTEQQKILLKEAVELADVIAGGQGVGVQAALIPLILEAHFSTKRKHEFEETQRQLRERDELMQKAHHALAQVPMQTPGFGSQRF